MISGVATAVRGLCGDRVRIIAAGAPHFAAVAAGAPPLCVGWWRPVRGRRLLRLCVAGAKLASLSFNA